MTPKLITINLFDKGDLVLTPSGQGIVCEDELIQRTFKSLGTREVVVRLFEDTSRHSCEDRIKMNGWLVSYMTGDEL